MFCNFPMFDYIEHGFQDIAISIKEGLDESILTAT